MWLYAACYGGILLHDLGSRLLPYVILQICRVYVHMIHTRKSPNFFAVMAEVEVDFLGLDFGSVFSDIVSDGIDLKTCLRKTDSKEIFSPNFAEVW